MNTSEWFTSQLRTSADGLKWAVQQVPVERYLLTPPQGDWSVARHIFHMLFFERMQALPFAFLPSGKGLPEWEDGDEDREWEEYGLAMGIERTLQEFQTMRSEQVALLAPLTEEDWSKVYDWGDLPVTLKWAITKTYQHSLDHTNTILKLALFWDFMRPKQ